MSEVPDSRDAFEQVRQAAFAKAIETGGLLQRAALLERKARPSSIPHGSWPRRMPADLAAGYCGESTVAGFLKRVVGKDYPLPRVAEGRRQLWLRDDLDAAIAPSVVQNDLAEDL